MEIVEQMMACRPEMTKDLKIPLPMRKVSHLDHNRSSRLQPAGALYFPGTQNPRKCLDTDAPAGSPPRQSNLRSMVECKDTGGRVPGERNLRAVEADDSSKRLGSNPDAPTNVQ